MENEDQDVARMSEREMPERPTAAESNGTVPHDAERTERVIRQIDTWRESAAGMTTMSGCEISAEAILGNCFVLINALSAEVTRLTSALQTLTEELKAVKEREARLLTAYEQTQILSQREVSELTAALQQAHQWQEIERAPLDGSTQLVVTELGERLLACWSAPSQVWTREEDGVACWPTHFLVLPPLPDLDKGKA